jgi:hypothetical protein
LLRNNRRNLLKAGAGLLIGSACVAGFNPLRTLITNAAKTKAAGITVTISQTLAGTSSYSPGLTNADNTLLYSNSNNDSASIDRVKTLSHNGLSLFNTQVMAWGADDMWPDPNTDEPNNWDSLDEKMQFALDTKATPVITLCEAPWWMKGELNEDGSTTLLTENDEWENIAYNSRVLDNKMDTWLHLVQRIAERYMVAPYNVRYFQVWNELKGYWNPITNRWDYENQAGDPDGNNAKHGYTYMYNLVYKKLKETAEKLGISRDSIKVGGPYIGLSTTLDDIDTELKKAYGNYDQRCLDVVKYWLKNKVGAEFITIDAWNVADQQTQSPKGPFVASEIFGDSATWIRSLDETEYPGSKTLPIWFAEWYAFPFANITNNYNNAVKSYAITKFIKAGGAVTLEWSGTGEGDAGGLWTPTTESGGGKSLPWYNSCKAFKQYFGPGTQLYTTTSSSSSIEVLASAARAMLINKTNTTLSVAVNGTTVTLTSYQVKVIARS